MRNGSFYHLPQQGSRRNPAKRFRWEDDERKESESCRLRRDEGFVVRSDDGQHRICLVCGEAAALPNALGGAKPCAQIPGGSPDPLLATIGEKHEKRY